MDEEHQETIQAEETPIYSVPNQPKKQSWWTKLNQKIVGFSLTFLLIGFLGGYQVSGMNTGKYNTPNTNEAQQTNGNMHQGGSPNNGETPPERPDVTSGASENQEDGTLTDDDSSTSKNKNTTGTSTNKSTNQTEDGIL
ncbi:hypothetical protein ACWOFR_05865 [Carnobacterium gallinarum]|uniref:hypothetical protein n=1 Tax=Carnobacterium gallinarum TaxID=2749 RepID=UPI00055409EC|nr:hypothetical protein [Carnobacterium gallinarum]